MTTRGKSREKFLLRQIEGTAWEVWAVGVDSRARLVQACDSPQDAQLSPHSVLALPLRQSFAIPLWLATTNGTLMREMVFLQLERRGLAGARSAPEAVFDFRILRSLESKTLVLAVSLPAALPGQLCLDLRNYEPSARTHLLPPDEFVLWLEGDRLALAVTQGAELVYFHALCDGSFTETVLQELQCIRLQLEAEDVIAHIGGITVWGDVSSHEISTIEERLNLPVRSGKRPEPSIPRQLLDLMPSSVRQARQVAKATERKMSLATAAACVYLLLLVFLVLRVGWSQMQCRRIESELKSNDALVKELQATAHRWDLLDHALNPASYPVEQLLRCARLLPADGVRFTLFKTTGDRIFIQGEAKNALAASRFAEELKQNRDLADYRWQMPQPRLLPNDTAEFQIEGAH